MSHATITSHHLGGSDCDHLSRSESRVTRRIGGGRQQILVGEVWVPYAPPPRPSRRAEPEPNVPVKDRPPDRCAQNHVADWYVNPVTGWRSCRICKREARRDPAAIAARNARRREIRRQRPGGE